MEYLFLFSPNQDNSDVVNDKLSDKDKTALQVLYNFPLLVITQPLMFFFIVSLLKEIYFNMLPLCLF